MTDKKRVLKRGMLNGEERAYCLRWRSKKTAEAMAVKLRRPLSTIEKFLALLETEPAKPVPVPRPSVRQLTLAAELKNRPEWASFESQFDEAELDFFEYQYVELMNQFGRDDVLPTEEIQVFQFITMGILASRALREQKVAIARIEKIHKILNGVGGIPTAKRAMLEAEQAECRRSNQASTGRLDGYLARQQSVLKDLKATRDQRKKVVEDGRKSFIGLIKWLASDEEARMRVGFEAGSMALAVEKETARLSTPHKYEDGTWDQPLLTSDTVLDDYGEDTPQTPEIDDVATT